MAVQRYINSKFWSDSWVERLSNDHKLLFLYLLTNEHTTIAGAYELSTRRMSAESGLDERTVVAALRAFGEAGKVAYVDGWVVVRNFSKHQRNWSESVQKGVHRIKAALPTAVLQQLEAPCRQPIGPIQAPPIQPEALSNQVLEGLNNSDSDSDSDSDIDSDSDSDAKRGEQPVDNSPPPASPAGSQQPASRPAPAQQPEPDPDLPAPSIPLDGLPPELRAQVDRHRKRAARISTAVGAKDAHPPPGEKRSAPDLDPFADDFEEETTHA